MREGPMKHLDQEDIATYKKGADQPQFYIPKERIKEASWGFTCKIWILEQEELFSTGNQIKLLLYIEFIMIALMNIILVSPYNTSTPQVIYSFRKILKVIFIIQTSST